MVRAARLDTLGQGLDGLDGLDRLGAIHWQLGGRERGVGREGGREGDGVDKAGTPLVGAAVLQYSLRAVCAGLLVRSGNGSGSSHCGGGDGDGDGDGVTVDRNLRTPDEGERERGRAMRARESE